MHALPRRNLTNLNMAARRKSNEKIIAYVNNPADPVSVHERHFNGRG